MCNILNNIIMRTCYKDSKGNNKVENRLGNNWEILQEPCVTITKEEQDNSTKKMSEK